MSDQNRAASDSTLRRPRLPPIGLGLGSIMLGAIGFGLFILPILGIPISIAGIVVGASGILIRRWRVGRESLRLSVAGILLSICGLTVAAAIARAPHGYFAPRAVFPTLRPTVDRLYVPPPAAPRNTWFYAPMGSITSM